MCWRAVKQKSNQTKKTIFSQRMHKKNLKIKCIWFFSVHRVIGLVTIAKIFKKRFVFHVILTPPTSFFTKWTLSNQILSVNQLKQDIIIPLSSSIACNGMKKVDRGGFFHLYQWSDNRMKEKSSNTNGDNCLISHLLQSHIPCFI